MRVLLGEVSAWGGAGKKALELRRRALSRPPGELLEEGLWPKKKEKKVSPGRGAGRSSPPSGAVLAQDTRGQCCVANVAEPQLAARSPTPLWSLKSAAKLHLESSRPQEAPRRNMLRARPSPSARRAPWGGSERLCSVKTLPPSWFSTTDLVPKKRKLGRRGAPSGFSAGLAGQPRRVGLWGASPQKIQMPL